MAIWQDSTGALHDDMAGAALSLPGWPQGMTQLTEAQAQALQNPLPTLDQARAAQIATITIAYQNAIAQPVGFTTAGGVTETFQADATSQQILVQTTTGYNLAGAVPEGFWWKAADNTPVPFILTDFKGLYLAMLAQGWRAFQQLQTLKTQINAAASVSSVEAVVWS